MNRMYRNGHSLSRRKAQTRCEDRRPLQEIMIAEFDTPVILPRLKHVLFFFFLLIHHKQYDNAIKTQRVTGIKIENNRK